MKSCILHSLLGAAFLVGAGCSNTATVCDKCTNSAHLRIQHKELQQKYANLACYYDYLCESMAEDYRCGRHNRVVFSYMEYYFQRRIGKMTISELKGLLGEPRVVSPGDGYYIDSLAGIYYADRAEQPVEVPHDKHDQVLHYGEGGPPRHSIPDESENLFFVVKDGIVINLWVLAP